MTYVDITGSGRGPTGLAGGAEWAAARSNRIGTLADRLDALGVHAPVYGSESERERALGWVHRTFFWTIPYDEFTASDTGLCGRLERACAEMRRRACAGHWAYDRSEHDALLRITRAEIGLWRANHTGEHGDGAGCHL